MSSNTCKLEKNCYISFIVKVEITEGQGVRMLLYVCYFCRFFPNVWPLQFLSFSIRKWRSRS